MDSRLPERLGDYSKIPVGPSLGDAEVDVNPNNNLVRLVTNAVRGNSRLVSAYATDMTVQQARWLAEALTWAAANAETSGRE